MRLRSLFATGLALCAALVGACSDTCHTYCDRFNQCPGVTPQVCDSFCVNNHDTAARIGCLPQREAFESCASGAPSVCGDALAAACPAESTAFGACVHDYCAAHAGTPECATP